MDTRRANLCRRIVRIMTQPSPLEVLIRRFEQPDEVRSFSHGRFEVVRIGTLTIGRATYEPGWKWSEHVGPQVNATRCVVEHFGLVVSGAATAAFDDSRIVTLNEGERRCSLHDETANVSTSRARSFGSE